MRLKSIRQAKLSEKPTVIESNKDREFFHYKNGKLEKYDCTKYHKKTIRLTSEENKINQKLFCNESEE